MKYNSRNNFLFFIFRFSILVIFIYYLWASNYNPMEETNRISEIHFAPLQGFTDAIFRNAFHEYFGGVNTYYTPFIRVENGNTFRNRDLRDISPENNTVPNLIPQILPGSPEEFRLLTELLQEKGYSAIDVNMGCPFPMIAGKKKGAGILPYPDRVKEVLETMNEYPGICFSLKMRLGWQDTGECINLLHIINNLRLCHVTVHARIGKQQYKGVTDVEAFQRFYDGCKHPLFFNGDLKTEEDCMNILEKFPMLRGVSIGRGLISSPLLAKKFIKNETFSENERMSLFSDFHRTLFSAYSERLQGEKQLLMKMKTLWEYFLPDSDRKLLKRIKKANKLTEYNDAVKSIFMG